MTTRNVFITGCSTGIGRALARACISRGDTVVATARNVDDLQYLDHDNAIRMALDVNDDSAIERVFEEVSARLGHIDLLINNAGYAAMGPLVDMPIEDLRAQFETNVFAPMELTKACLPLLTSKQHAQVVNIGSVSGITTTPFSGAYCATKAALHSLSDAHRMELAPFGIEVITVQPGAIESKFGDNSLANVLQRITPDSLYAPLKEDIKARATASQDNPTPAKEFAELLVEQLLNKPKPIIRIGNGSCTLPLLKRWLPTKVLDNILSKKFNLSKLKDS